MCRRLIYRFRQKRAGKRSKHDQWNTTVPEGYPKRDPKICTKGSVHGKSINTQEFTQTHELARLRKGPYTISCLNTLEPVNDQDAIVIVFGWVRPLLAGSRAVLRSCYTLLYCDMVRKIRKGETCVCLTHYLCACPTALFPKNVESPPNARWLNRIGRRTWGSPGNYWRDYIPQLVWENLGLSQQELEYMSGLSSLS